MLFLLLQPFPELEEGVAAPVADRELRMARCSQITSFLRHPELPEVPHPAPVQAGEDLVSGAHWTQVRLLLRLQAEAAARTLALLFLLGLAPS